MSMELEKMEEGSVYLLLAVYCISTSACFEERTLADIVSLTY